MRTLLVLALVFLPVRAANSMQASGSVEVSAYLEPSVRVSLSSDKEIILVELIHPGEVLPFVGIIQNGVYREENYTTWAGREVLVMNPPKEDLSEFVRVALK